MHACIKTALGKVEMLDVPIPDPGYGEIVVKVTMATGAGGGFPSMYESAMGKCFAKQMAAEATSAAMTVFGGYGYSKEFPAERMHRDGLAWRVAGGTAQMLKITMASILFTRRFDQRAQT